MPNTMYKINGRRTRKTRKRESGVFPRGQWCVLRSPGCCAVVPLSLRDLLDSQWCVSLAVCEEASIKPGQCQRQKQAEHIEQRQDQYLEMVQYSC